MDSTRSLHQADSSRPGSPVTTPGSSRGASWGAWAGSKIKQFAQNVTSDDSKPRVVPVEKIYVFPGWASRRYHDMDNTALQDAPFDMQVSVYGWCSSHNPPGSLSRSQRAFIRLAKGYAALPKLTESLAPTPPSGSGDRSPMSRSTEDLIKQLHLPPPPSEMTSEEAELAALEEQLRRVNMSEDELQAAFAEPPPRMSSSSSYDTSPNASSSSLGYQPIQASNNATQTSLSQMHANLEARLLPFWSSVLSNRTVRLSLYIRRSDSTSGDKALSSHKSTPSYDEAHSHPGDAPIAVQHVHTGADGAFAFSFGVPFEALCTHPAGLHIAFGSPTQEHTLDVRAELLAPPPAPPAPAGRKSMPPVSAAITTNTAPIARVETQIPLSHSPVRLISDIDDTIKFSNILSGARSVFFNVFVKELHEALIPGMPEWYNALWKRGVRFHYVSNGPFEILPVITDFFRLSQLPAGSVRLRSYAGRALFNGLMTAPAIRKRAGVEDVLGSFPFSRFILVGDSGEQDLELYSQLAAERSRQILAVFIRDVNQGGPIEPVDDPTGANPPRPSTAERSDSMMSSAGSGAMNAAPTRQSSTSSSWTNSIPASLNRSTSASSDLEPPRPPFAVQAHAPRDSTLAIRPASPTLADLGIRTSTQKHTPRTPSMSSTASASSTSSDLATPRPAYAPYRSARSRASSASSVATTASVSHSTNAQSFAANPFGPNTGASGVYNTRSPVAGAFSSALSGSPLVEEPEHHLSPELEGSAVFFTPNQMQSQSQTGSGKGEKAQVLSEPERKRQELQTRIYKARSLMPGHIPLRIFRDPRECVEAGEILDELRIGAEERSP